MNTRRTLAVSLVVCLLAAPSVAAPTAVEFQGVTIGSKLRTTPVTFANKVGLAGGGLLGPGTYDVEIASTGDKSRVMLLFFQKGRKMGETPGVLKLGTAPGGAVAPCGKPGGIVGPCGKPGGAIGPCGKGVNPCARPGAGVAPCGKTASLCTNEKGSKTGLLCNAKAPQGASQSSSRYFSFEQLGFTGGVKPSLRAGAGGGTLLIIPGVGGASVEAQLPAAH